MKIAIKLSLKYEGDEKEYHVDGISESITENNTKEALLKAVDEMMIIIKEDK